MKRVSSMFVVTVSLLMSSLAAAQNLDHLICYRVIDPLPLQVTASFLAQLQPDFSQKGCTVLKPVEFCVPASKLNVTPAPPFPSISGQPLQDDYICYQVKCPQQPVPANKLVADQFGQRIESEFRPAKICVPARKGSLPCGSTGFRQCGGQCPRAGDVCRPHPADQGCTCAPEPCGGTVGGGTLTGTRITDPGGLPPVGSCGGLCPNSTDRCVPDSAGRCVCQPPPPPPCGLNQATGICGGTCPNPLDKCTFTPGTTECTCKPPPTTCPCQANCTDLAGTPGICRPVAGTNACSCVALDPPCSLNSATNQCGGQCPAPKVCQLGAAGCFCQ